MSTDDKNARDLTSDDKVNAPRKKSVSFPTDDEIVTEFFEPPNPWKNVPPTTRAALAADYLEHCRRHDTPPIDCVLQQIRELPESSIGGAARAQRLCLTNCRLQGAAPADALEAVFRRVQLARIEVDNVAIDDECAEALFDMIEYYESAQCIHISGERHFGIRGWQAASRMIKKSSQLSELEVSEQALEAGHAAVLSRALHAHSCRLRALCLTRVALAGEPLLCLVIALKSNNSVRELRLGDNRLTSADAQQLASLLRYNTRVALLDLSNNMIQDSGVGHIADALSVQATLTPPSSTTSPVSPHQCPLSGHEPRGLAVLVLWNNQLTRNCAQHLSKVLTSNSLCVLNVGRNAVGADAVRALAAGALVSLVSLGLQATRLGPDAARAVGGLVAGCRLQRLDLRDNKLGAAGLQAILVALREKENTLTQIDLDDPPETSTLTAEDSDSATIARLTREISSLLRDKEPPLSPQRRVHRKISLTCHSDTGSWGRPWAEEERSCRRLRSPLPSPAPSPAGSPVPTHSRFSVTPVRCERDGRQSTPKRPSCCTTSRFKVVQVTEAPQIHVQSPETPRRSSSRFSVTRNYDSAYNPTPTPSPPPSSGPSSPAPELHTTKSSDDHAKINQVIDSDNDKTCDVKSDKISDKTDTLNDNYHDKAEVVSHSEVLQGDKIKTLTKFVTNSSDKSDTDKVELKVEVTVQTETCVDTAKVHNDQIIVVEPEKKEDKAMKQIEAITEDLGNLIKEMKDLTTKTAVLNKVKDDNCGDKIDSKNINVPVSFTRDNVVLKKNKSESSLDSPDLEVSRLMNKKLVNSAFCDSSSSLEISGSSMESLNEHQITKPIIIQESIESDTELDRRKSDNVTLSTESSMESTSDTTPVNNSRNFLNMSVSSNDSVSPINFGKTIKIHGSLSSLEASVCSLDSAKQDKAMVTSADSGIEYSLQNPSEKKEGHSSNEGTLTNYSSLKDKPECFQLQDTLTSSPKRASSLLDVPAMKSKGLDRMRKISWVPPSSSFHIPRPEPEKAETKLPSHLEKLLSLFQHPTSLFSRSTNEDEKKSASNTLPRKDSTLTSSFWSWGSGTEKEKQEDKIEDKEDGDSSEATDSTLSERIQVSFVDESFSKKLDSKTPSTDTESTENTLSEFQSFAQGASETSETSQEKVTELTTDENIVQNLVVSVYDNSNGYGRVCDIMDLIKPNDLNRNLPPDDNKNTQTDMLEDEEKTEAKEERVERPRSFAAVLKASGSENSLEKPSPDNGQPVDKLPMKVIRGIKENISPENTLTSSMTNTKALAIELTENKVKNHPTINTVWELALDKDVKDDLKAPIATIEETCDESADNFVDDIKFIDEKNVSSDSGVTSLEGGIEELKKDITRTDIDNVDLGKDALSYLIYENQDFEPITEPEMDVPGALEGSLADELKQAEIKEKLQDLSPELVIDEAVEIPEVFIDKLKTSPVLSERAKLKKSNSLEDLALEKNDSPKTKTIAFKIPDTMTTPQDIPKRTKLRSRGGSSPKSLPESLNKPSPIYKMDSIKKKKKVSSLGKIAKDSLLSLNMTEDEIAEFRRSYKLTSVESLRSLESVSEDANSQSGTSLDSRCRSCLRTSQESLMSLDSITEDCKCSELDGKGKPSRSAR